MMRYIFTILGVLCAFPAWAAQEKAIFAGGCFWCMESEFSGIKGVSNVISGYTGGHVANPTYQEVSGGETGHFEAIEVEYDAAIVPYEKLLEIFWDNVDPLDEKGQFCDKGSQYRAGIFPGTDEQKILAEASKAKAEKRYGQPVATIIQTAGPFYPAEDYHQDYYRKNQLRYAAYRTGCGRDGRLQELHAQ